MPLINEFRVRQVCRRDFGFCMRGLISTLLLNLALIACIGCRKSTQLSGGMEPTIKRGEQVTINYLAYATTDPQRWDVVAVTPLSTVTTNNSMWLKRVIALPGEVVSLTQTGIVVNGSVVIFPPALSNVVYCLPQGLPSSRTGFVTFPYTVPMDHYFVVGDDWSNSFDSRYFGAIRMTNILGKVVGK
jgi:signal peptidase I